MLYSVKVVRQNVDLDYGPVNFEACQFQVVVKGALAKNKSETEGS